MSGSVVDVVARRDRRALATPLGFGAMTITERSYCLVEVHLDDGRVGYSQSIDRGIDVSAIVREILAPAYIRSGPATTAEAWGAALRSASPAVSSGAGLRALSLVDIALSDARHEPTPTSVPPPVWVIVGYPPTADAATVARETRVARDLGAAGVKLPVGPDPDLTRQRLLAAVAEMGAERVAIDLAWSAESPDAAARVVDGIGVAWLEDPFPPGRVRDLRRLRSLRDVPLAVGDEDAQLYHPEVLVEAGAVDIVRLDATSQGGVTRMREVATELVGGGIPVSWHMSASLHSRLASALPFETLSVEISAPGAGVDPLDEQRPLADYLAQLRA
ncbi:enolase C-terminal domain-like protein [soil metagenome]